MAMKISRHQPDDERTWVLGEDKNGAFMFLDSGCDVCNRFISQGGLLDLDIKAPYHEHRAPNQRCVIVPPTSSP